MRNQILRCVHEAYSLLLYRPTEYGNNSTQRQQWGIVSHFLGTCHREPIINKIYT